MAESLDAAPPTQNLFFIEVALDQADKNGLAFCVEGREERAASFGLEQFVQGEGTVDGDAFELRPQIHRVPAV